MTLFVRKRERGGGGERNVNLTFTCINCLKRHTYTRTHTHTHSCSVRPQNTRKTIRCSGNANNVSKFNYSTDYVYAVRTIQNREKIANNQNSLKRLTKCYGFVLLCFCLWALYFLLMLNSKIQTKIRVFECFVAK